MSNQSHNRVEPTAPAGERGNIPAGKSTHRGLLGAGRVFGLLAMVSCCAGPTILLGLGLGVAWASGLTLGIVMIFVALAAVFFVTYEKRNLAYCESELPVTRTDVSTQFDRRR